ncbi:hypothetical protein MHM84_20360 [Halomonas sp. McH1-25]|uniref:hypothetical protein n=1 Tax=unclassified Halomonas TaxID=2609666 RepID=UPI001EF4AA91|nr:MULTISPECIES: hypothetical protein [unclassified Halomonas]MCG7602098.1 hypothetical protein [Halomonas sp. McH1-25]MCP1343014.1 hypothetical protein [Halomonas sp. FL8]MCP1362436.1 hypothetical protein [Halomonas sp. BBD45]MCP1364094.1 hypothetical protein [Halomonas sp. BBD48]
MGRTILLGLLLIGTVMLFMTINASPTQAQEEPLADWDMHREIQNASDTERNPWRRGYDE